MQKDRATCAPRIARKLTGRARDALVGMTPPERAKLRQPTGTDFLIDFLKAKLGGAPALDIGKYLEKYLFSTRRGRNETMSGYIQRESSNYGDLARASSRMERLHGIPEAPVVAATTPEGPAPAATEGTSAAGSARGSVSDAGDGTNAAQTTVPLTTSDVIKEVLPQFVRAWFLLRRAGLPTGSRTTMIAHLDSKYEMPNVVRRLEESFDDSDLLELDRPGRGQAFEIDEDHEEAEDDWTEDSWLESFCQDDSDAWGDEAYYGSTVGPDWQESGHDWDEEDWDGEHDWEESHWADQDSVVDGAATPAASYMGEDATYLQALDSALIAQGRSCLEAKDLRRSIATGRQFFPGKGKGKYSERRPPVCFRCGGPHFSSESHEGGYRISQKGKGLKGYRKGRERQVKRQVQRQVQR